MPLTRRLFALAAPVVALSANARADTNDTLDGIWQGSLTPIQGRRLRLAEGDWQPFQIAISTNSARVFLRDETSDVFNEIKAGAFRISRIAKSAVLNAIDADPNAPVGQSWVESWSFSVTLIGPDTLSCAFTRQVNNHQARPSDDGAIFTMVLSGELQRAATDHV